MSTSGGLFFITISISAMPCYTREEHHSTDIPFRYCPIFMLFNTQVSKKKYRAFGGNEKQIFVFMIVSLETKAFCNKKESLSLRLRFLEHRHNCDEKIFV